LFKTNIYDLLAIKHSCLENPPFIDNVLIETSISRAFASRPCLGCESQLLLLLLLLLLSGLVGLLAVLTMGTWEHSERKFN